jgi:hypothetical protein
MYENKISMATLGGHGLGAKIALATACYHFDHVTGYIGLDSSPMNQYYHEHFTELRNCFSRLGDFNISRSYSAISHELKNTVICPKWRDMFLNNLVKTDTGYEWNFNFQAISDNLLKESPSNLTCWHSSIGLYPGRSMFSFPEYSRFVHLSTNTLPMYSVCPRLQGLNHDIFMTQSDDNPQSTPPPTQTTGSTNTRTSLIPTPSEWPTSCVTMMVCMCSSKTGTKWAITTFPTSTTLEWCETTSLGTAALGTTTITGALMEPTPSDPSS